MKASYDFSIRSFLYEICCIWTFPFITVIPKCRIEIAFDYANDIVYKNPLRNTQVFFSTGVMELK